MLSDQNPGGQVSLNLLEVKADRLGFMFKEEL